MRTEATMAYPEGRLLALRDGVVHVLAPDGWSKLGPDIPRGAALLTREDAEDWCERQGWELELLDAVPRRP
jgi:hypothetical protein